MVTVDGASRNQREVLSTAPSVAAASRSAAGLDQARRLACVANMILRFLDWAIRKNRPGEIDFWLDHADWLFGAS